jgi:nucleotide-binding universal stress UspA family protein
MIRFERILFPVDFSDQCVAIVPAVKAMTKQFDAELTLFHVVDLPIAWLGLPEASAWAALINTGQLQEQGRIARAESFVQGTAIRRTLSQVPLDVWTSLPTKSRGLDLTIGSAEAFPLPVL